MEKEYGKAAKVFHNCQEKLVEYKQYNENREFRLTYNFVISLMREKYNIQVISDICSRLKAKTEKNSYNYSRLLLLMAWQEGIMGGSCMEGYKRAEDALKVNKEILPENHIDFALNYYILAVLSRHLLQEEDADYYLEKAKNILKNHRKTENKVLRALIEK